MSKIFKSIMLYASLAISVNIAGVLVQSCGDDCDTGSEVRDEADIITEYLESSKDILTSKEGLYLFNKAFQRIESHLVVENDTCYLTVHSASELNMSDELFDLMRQTVNNANIQYKAYLLLKDCDEKVTVKNPFELNRPVISVRIDNETVSGPYNTTTYTTLSDRDVTVVLNSMRASNGSLSTFAGLIGGYFPGGASSVLIAAYGYFNDSSFANIQNEYARSGSTNGITLITSSTYSPMTGMNCTTYSSIINR